MDGVHPYFLLAVFSGVAFVFPLMPLVMAWMWRRFFQPPKPGEDKNSIYECGIKAHDGPRIRFKPQYYLYCIIFLIFDVESVFLIPFAVAFTDLPIGGFISALVFIFLLLEGLVWAWAKGLLNWAR